MFKFLRIGLVALLWLAALPTVQSFAADAVPVAPSSATDSDMKSLFSVDRGSAINGRIRAVNHADIASNMDARIKQIPVREGDGFRKGDLLLEFDCAVEYAQLASADAAYKAAREKAQVSKELEQLDSISKLELVMARADAEKARAEQQIWQEKVRRCSIYAPYSGHVAALYVQPFEYARQGDKLMKILDDTHLEVEALIPSSWLTSITLGMPFSLVIDETGVTYQATVKSIGAEIDSVSQTVKLIGDIQGDNRGLIAGMSGRLIMPFANGSARQ